MCRLSAAVKVNSCLPVILVLKPAGNISCFSSPATTDPCADGGNRLQGASFTTVTNAETRGGLNEAYTAPHAKIRDLKKICLIGKHVTIRTNILNRHRPHLYLEAPSGFSMLTLLLLSFLEPLGGSLIET